MSKCDVSRGRGLPSQVRVSFFNSFPRSLKDSPTLNVLKTLLEGRLANFVDEFLVFDWETVRLTD